MKFLLLLALTLLSPAPVAAQEAEETAPSVRQWEADPAQSSITFRGRQMGKDFAGVIPAFTAKIYFDPENLDQSGAVVDIPLAAIDAKDAESNKILRGGDWLDVEKFPAARFETQKISRAEDGGYVAAATLTIRDVAQEITLPFTLDFSKSEKGRNAGKEQAVMNGKVTLDRSKFQLGQGDWEDPGIIANEVAVEIRVVAYAEPAPQSPEKEAEDQAPSATP